MGEVKDFSGAPSLTGLAVWQTIDTAPKDGTPFLAYLPQAEWHASLKPTITTLYWAPWENFASLYSERLGESEGDCGDWGPTHWMPLPAPPSLDEPSVAAHGTARHPIPDTPDKLIAELCEVLLTLETSRKWWRLELSSAQWEKVNAAVDFAKARGAAG